MSNPATLALDQTFGASPAPRPARSKSVLRQLSQIAVVAAVAAVSYLATSEFILQSVKVVGLSMNPTLRDSHHYFLNKGIYYFRSPRRAEVVVLRDPQDNGFVVKRVVATPGDSVCLKEGGVYVNGRKLTEPYLPGGMPTFACSQFREQLFRCGSDQYFVLGDNRGNSVDSRAYGPVSRQSILGMIIQ